MGQRIRTHARVEKGNGRDHAYGFTMWMAGGGVKTGIAYGGTDEFGFAVENPVSLRPARDSIAFVRAGSRS
ncbi:MAG: DUF1501 domain-containing protein [Blastocatellia bacterium]